MDLADHQAQGTLTSRAYPGSIDARVFEPFQRKHQVLIPRMRLAGWRADSSMLNLDRLDWSPIQQEVPDAERFDDTEATLASRQVVSPNLHQQTSENVCADQHVLTDGLRSPERVSARLLHDRASTRRFQECGETVPVLGNTWPIAYCHPSR